MHSFPNVSSPLAIHERQRAGGGFDLDAYLNALAPHLIECFRRRFSGHSLYELLTREQVHPIPVSLRTFLDGLTRFRFKIRSLDPIQRDLLDNRIARLYPPSGPKAPGFTPIILPPPQNDDDPGEVNSGV